MATRFAWAPLLFLIPYFGFHLLKSIQQINLFVDSRHTRFADLRWAGFSAQMLMRSTELSATTKLSAGHETPPIANVLL